MTYAPTDEQQSVIDAFAAGKTLAVEAGAGTGKTSTLLFLADELGGRSGQYVAFNKAIVVEAEQKFPAGVRANTAHSLAFRAVGRRFARRLKARRQRNDELADLLGIDAIHVSDRVLPSDYLAGLVLNGITNFCRTTDPRPTSRHIGFVEGIDAPGEFTNNNALSAELESYLTEAWVDLTNPAGVLPYKHDHYLKLWQLSSPRIDADVIFFDEAQDANPVLSDIVSQQSHAQIVWVGDSQQQLYDWTGAINSLAKVEVDERLYLSQSFRFGEAVAEAANEVLALLDTPLRLRGLPTIPSTVGYVESPNACLYRTNAGVVKEAIEVVRNGGRPYVVGGTEEVVKFAKSAGALKSGRPAFHPDLACFRTWDEVTAYVKDAPQGSELRLLVGLVNQIGVPDLINTLDGLPRSPKGATVTLSTAHKSKGKEWPSVRLGDDYREHDPANDAPLSDAEWRLLYVAVTRAQNNLDRSAVKALESIANTAADTDTEEV